MKVSANGVGGERRKRRTLQRSLIISWGTAADGNRKKLYQQHPPHIHPPIKVCSLFGLVSLPSLLYLFSFLSSFPHSKPTVGAVASRPSGVESLKVICQ